MPDSATDPPDRPGEPVLDSRSVAAEPGAAAEPAGDFTARPVEDAGGTRPAHRRRRKVVGWFMVGLGLFILASVVWLGYRSYEAYYHLKAASDEVSTLQKELENFTTSDPAYAATIVQRLQQETAGARSSVDDPIFRGATLMPFVGANFDALREVTLTVDSLANDVMPSLVDISATLQPDQLAPKHGAIDLAPIERISPVLRNADAAVTAARQRVADIDRSAVLQPVGDAVLNLTTKLDRAADVTGPAARISRLLPPMLGSDKPRTYLVVFQNPAELRATGGIFGSYALVKADHGKVTIAAQGASSRTLGFFDPPVAKLPKNQIELYSRLMAQYPMDVNFTPDYPTAAPLFIEMFRQRRGVTVDGVLALDPVALSYTLEGTPPIDVGDGVQVTSDNLVSVLLSTAYKKFDNDPQQSERDAFLAAATSTVFNTVTSGKADPAAIIDGLRRAVNQRRVLMYSNDPAEQADLATTGVSGAFSAGEGRPPTVGVFFNDGTAAKLGYYLTNEVHVTAGDCRPDGRRELAVTVVMRYNAPTSVLPEYVSGRSKAGGRNQLQTNVLVFAPVGGGIVGAARDGTPIAIGRGEDLSRQAGTSTVILKPGTSTELVFTVLAPAGASDPPPGLVVTPGVNPVKTSVDTYPACSPAN